MSIVNKFLRYFFYWPIRLTANCNPVPFEPLKSLNIDKSKPIVYAMVSSSLGNMLTLERLTNSLGLPSPFEPLYLHGKKLHRTAYLRRPSLFGSKAHIVDASIRFQEWVNVLEGDEDIQIIPVTILWSRNPSYEGLAIRGVDAPTPSWRKFLTLTFAGRDNCTILIDPISARALKHKMVNKNWAIINRRLALYFLKKARAVVGKAFPNRRVLIQELLKRPGTVAAIKEEMTRSGKSYEELEHTALHIFKVMVADTRYPLLKFINSVISLLWHRIYHGQTIRGAQRVRDLVQSGHEIIYIPCHRSHMDYILLSFVIFHEGLPLPQVASGDNLNFFPVGPLIRRCGSYFIRRKMKGDKFYTAMFREYLLILFERGYATEFFIEGGRSRTGRTLPPRTGMVSMTVQAQLRGIERPIAFVPTYLGYEHVMEVGSYMRELGGIKKQKESAWDLLGIFKRLRYYGRGYVTFGEPIIVPKFLQNHVPTWKDDIDPTGLRRPDWLHSTVNLLSREIIIKLNDSATVNGINLCALALIHDEDRTVSMNVLRRCINLFLEVLKCDPARHKSLPQDLNVNTLIRQALELNKFHTYDVGDLKFVRPSDGQTMQLMYFQNNILHLFALPALVANILIRHGHILRKDVNIHTRSLFYFLRHELYAPVSEQSLDSLIEVYIDTFIKLGYITENDKMLYISGDGFSEFLILSRSIRPSLVRYLVGVATLKQMDDGTINIDTFIARCIESAKSLPSDVSNSPEFADPIMFKILTETLIRHNYFTILEDGTLKKNSSKVDKLARAAEPLLPAREVKTLYEQHNKPTAEK